MECRRGRLEPKFRPLAQCCAQSAALWDSRDFTVDVPEKCTQCGPTGLPTKIRGLNPVSVFGVTQ